MLNTPWQMLLVMLAGWVNEQHRVLFQNSADARIQGCSAFSTVLALRSRLTCRILERAGLGDRPIEGVPKPSAGVVLRHERLGGILSHYYRTAA